MTNKGSSPIASILREIGTNRCIEKAEALEKESSPIRFLNLRDLDLNTSDVISIANCLNQEKEHYKSFLKSISFSYNILLGDTGAIALANNLPNYLCEIGLVNCGISDIGGIEILNWIKTSTNLQMICIEQNHFSEKLKLEFRKFSSNRPLLLVVV